MNRKGFLVNNSRNKIQLSIVYQIVSQEMIACLLINTTSKTFDVASSRSNSVRTSSQECRAIVLCTGDKSGEKQFYDRMISRADKVFSRHLDDMKRKNK